MSIPNIPGQQPDLAEDRTLRNVLEEMNATLREMADFLYTMRDLFQYVQTPIQGTVAVSNFPAPASAVSITNLPATQPVSIADGMQDRVIRNLLEELVLAVQEQTRVLLPLIAAQTGNLTITEGIN